MFFRRAFLTLLIALYIDLFPASASWSPAGARALSLSGCQVTAEDVWSCRNNPAGLGSLSGFRSGAFYESRFVNSGIASKAVCASVSLGKVASVGTGITEFGNNNMKEQSAAFSLARPFGSKMKAGASVEWHTLRFAENYGAASALTASFGILLQINSAASFGVAVRNPFRAAYKNSVEPIASILNAGFKWKVSGRTSAFLESEMSPGIPYSLRSGLEYVSAADFSIRLGVSNTYLPVSFGTGFRIRNVVVDLSASYHLQLGTTMSVSLIYSKK